MKYINHIYPETKECITKSGRHRNNFFIKLVGNYWKLYVALPERKHRDIHFPCPPGKLLGEDEIFHPVLIEGVVKKYTRPYFHLSYPKNSSWFLESRLKFPSLNHVIKKLIQSLIPEPDFFLESQSDLIETHCSNKNNYNSNKLENL